MSFRTKLTDLGMTALNNAHRGILRATGGRVGWSVGRMPVVELHTRGRSTGRRRSTMLTAPVHGNGRYILVASRGGDIRHPDWYRNLVANPDVELTVKDSTFLMRARTASPSEKAELWPEIVAAYPGYARYERKTTRDIPVVICEPRESPQAAGPATG
jgi:deazaflavin-dependent oxidoreductase (nitroreductase family)